MTMPPVEASMTQTLVNQVYNQLFGDSGQLFDLYEGTIFSPANTRIVYLSADIIKGIHEALSYEAGDAWRVILRNCGLRWGNRVAAAFDKELRTIANRRMDTLTVNEYLEMLETYFSLHGWGKLAIDLELAERAGIVTCRLRHSIFTAVLGSDNGPVNSLIEGMLQGIFSTVSQNDLQCLEIVASATATPPENIFVISGRERLGTLEGAIEGGMPLETVLEQLQE